MTRPQRSRRPRSTCRRASWARGTPAVTWRIPAPRSRRLLTLVGGLVLFGASLAMLVEADLGLDPWDVFHQGFAETVGARLGVVVVLVSVAVLILWVPLRQPAGLGTILNALVVGLVVELVLVAIPDIDAEPARWVVMLAGVGLNGVAVGMYIGAGLGPGPRDGLMTALARGRSLRAVRTSIEVIVLGAGWLLGGTVGVATVVYAAGIGPVVHVMLPLFTIGEASPRGAARPGRARAGRADAAGWPP